MMGIAFGSFPPCLGELVFYNSPQGDKVVSPAMVIRTKGDTVKEVLPDSFEDLDDDFSVDLIIFGLEKTYRKYNVPKARQKFESNTWSWYQHLK